MKRLPTTVTIDHVGKFLEPVEPDHEGFKALLRLIDTGKVWYKLAAPYETSKLGPPFYDDVGKLAKILAKHAPERGVWASNWPHPMAGERTPQHAWMLDMLLDWVPDEATRTRFWSTIRRNCTGINSASSTARTPRAALAPSAAPASPR